MIKLVVTNEKNLELTELEKVHVGENKFGYYLIYLPEVLNDYKLSECNVELVQILADDTSVSIHVDTITEERPIKEYITLDATSQAQMVTLSVLITHNGDVIGKTNQKTYQVYPTKNATPIDPREELDEIIAELRADKAELETTVSEQATEITEKNTRITELSGEVADLNSEVTELTSDNTRLENLTDTQRETIQNMLDNPPQPKLYTPPEPIIPETETRVYTPPQNYDGFASFTVKGNKYLNVDLQKFLARDIDFDLEIQADTIGDYLCYRQTGLVTCRLTGNPTRIYTCAFYGCSSLQTINLPNSVTSIGDSAFEGCNALTSLTIPDSVISIGASAFSGCSRLTSLDLGNGVTSISNYAFNGCNALTSLTIPDSVTSIGAGAFGGCSRLTSLDLGNGVTSISNYAFNGCYALTSLTIPDSVTSIGASAFSGCSRLTSLTIPDSVTSIANNAFYNCSSLQFVTIESGFNCNGLNLSASTLYSHDTILSWLNALADRTGQTAYTLTIGTANLNKMTAEEKAIATNKNWNLA